MSKFIITGIIIFTAIFSSAQSEVPILRFKELEPLLYNNNDTVYVINFWATWCIPCRKEIPEFEKIQNEFQNQKVKIILVSLDFANQINESLIPYLIKNQVKSKVVLLNDPDMNSWIDKVNPAWTGSLPATLFYNKNTRYFVEDELNYEKIKLNIEKLSIN
jgi:thiol-disulfide isomerase/thioredoxin